MNENVPIKLTGTATAGISAARQLRRNMNTTMITKATAINMVRSASRRLARMVVVRSITRLRSTEAGIDACNCGTSAMTRSTVSIMLAFGCPVTITTTEGLPLAKPALRMSCTESTTLATSLRRTGALLRYATMIGM